MQRGQLRSYKMPKASKRHVTVGSKPVNAATAKPAKAAKPVLLTGKPVNGPGEHLPIESAASGVNVVSDVLASTVAAAAVPAVVDTAPRGLTRDAAGIVRYATNYAQYSDRDTAYLAFFGSVCRAHSGSATLRDIHGAGITRTGMPDRKRFNPNYTGSAKATDVGAINRLCKAGYFTRSADGNTISATVLATSSKAYAGT